MFSKYNLVLSSNLKTGMVIAQPVISEKKHILLKQGAIITEDTIKKLLHWGITAVNVACPDPRPSVSPYLFSIYNETLNSISSIFEKVRQCKEVPITECQELAEKYIKIIIDTEGVLDALYRITTYHEYTFTHSLHVAILAGLLGKWTGFSDAKRTDFILSGLLHDIGKALVPRKILDKPGPLTADEMDIIKLHSSQGYHLLSNCAEISEEAKLGVLQHHEREDGSGYPLGLKGKDISTCAKFVAIADIYDAMTTERVYRKKMLPFTAINIMLNQMGDTLDSATCLTLSINLRKFLIGMRVLLSNGKQGTVVQMLNIATARPIVRLDNGIFLDLDNDETITVVAVLD